MASTSLTGIFAPGSPALVENLRTLVLEPRRTAAPGEIVRAEFTFSNFGGAKATGVRVRFSHPQGALHVAEADRLDERPLLEGSLTDTIGAPVGDVEPGGARRVSASFRVNDTIEDGSELVFQAALVSDQTPLLATNLERIVVRSRPVLDQPPTTLTLSAPEHPHPGDLLTIAATVANTGSSSANDVVVLLPAPEFTTYVARSARIDGRVVPGVEGDPFDYDSAVVVSPRLAPGQSASIEYQVTIDAPLADATAIVARGTVGSREVGEFPIASQAIAVESPVDFGGEETALTLLCDDAVAPGMRIPMTLRAVNAGTGAAEAVSIAFALPPGLRYAPGSAFLDGAPVADENVAGLTFSVGRLRAGGSIEAGITVTVAVPPAGEDSALPVEAALRWKGGERDFSRRLAARVAPRFSRARNFVEADRGSAHAREELRFLVHVYNDGTAPERGVRLRVIPGVHLEAVRVGESSDEAAPYREPIELGIVEPHHARTFTIAARVASKVPDRSNVTLGAVLEHEGGAIDLGTATVVVRSRPQVAPESVVWEVATTEPLRPHRFADVVLRLRNSGSDVLRDARVTLLLPPELSVERAIDARRERDGLALGDIPAETEHISRLTVRLLRPVPADRPLVLEGWLHGKGISPVQLAPLDLATYAEPEFARTAQFLVAPTETVNAGERVYYEVRLRNDGDGPADRLIVRVVPTNLAVYVPGSTTLNGLAIGDDTGTSSLWSQRGLVLSDVYPGVELRIRWEMSVMSPLAEGTPLETRAVLEWGEGATLALAAPTVKVQSQATLGESALGVTPISIARIFPEDVQAYAPPPLPPDEPTFPPATPTPLEAPPRAIAEMIATQPLAAAATPTVEAEAIVAAAPTLYLDFAADRLESVLRMLERADAGGLVQHLFALRLLFPENAVASSPTLAAAFTSATRALRAPLERFFVRLRMPRLAITGKDLEDRDGRFALRALLSELLAAPAALPTPPPPGIVRVEGPVDLDLLRALATELEGAPLGAVTPWVVNAQMLGTYVLHDGERHDALAAYREGVLKVFSLLSELPIDEFHRVLTTSVNRGLDAALADAIESLRGAAHLSVD